MPAPVRPPLQPRGRAWPVRASRAPAPLRPPLVRAVPRCGSAACGPLSMNERTSSRVTRPPAPVPVSCATSMPCSRTRRRTAGVMRAAPLAPLPAGDGSARGLSGRVGLLGCGGRWLRLRLGRCRCGCGSGFLLLDRGRAGIGSVRCGLGFGLRLCHRGLWRRGFRGRCLFRRCVLRRSLRGDAIGVDLGDRGADGDGLPIGDEDLRDRPGDLGRHLGVHLVGDDLEERVVLLDGVAFLDQPALDRAFGDRFAQLGHLDRGCHRFWVPLVESRQ